MQTIIPSENINSTVEVQVLQRVDNIPAPGLIPLQNITVELEGIDISGSTSRLTDITNDEGKSSFRVELPRIGRLYKARAVIGGTGVELGVTSAQICANETLVIIVNSTMGTGGGNSTTGTGGGNSTTGTGGGSSTTGTGGGNSTTGTGMVNPTVVTSTRTIPSFSCAELANGNEIVSDIDFGQAASGTARIITITLTNSGTEPINTVIPIPFPPPFVLLSVNGQSPPNTSRLPAVIPANGQTTISVFIKADVRGDYNVPVSLPLSCPNSRNGNLRLQLKSQNR